MFLWLPTPGSTTQTNIVPSGKNLYVLHTMKAALSTSCGLIACEISTIREDGETEMITPFIAATYESDSPKSVRSAMTGRCLIYPKKIKCDGGSHFRKEVYKTIL